MFTWINGDDPPASGLPTFYMVDATTDPYQVIIRVCGELDL